MFHPLSLTTITLALAASPLALPQEPSAPALLEARITEMRAAESARAVAIGVHVDSLPAALAAHLGLDEDGGILVVGVQDDMPAARAGLRLHDVITRADGEPLRTHDDLRAALEDKQPGDALELSVRRGDRELSLKVEVAESVRQEGSETRDLARLLEAVHGKGALADKEHLAEAQKAALLLHAGKDANAAHLAAAEALLAQAARSEHSKKSLEEQIQGKLHAKHAEALHEHLDAMKHALDANLMRLEEARARLGEEAEVAAKHLHRHLLDHAKAFEEKLDVEERRKLEAEMAAVADEAKKSLLAARDRLALPSVEFPTEGTARIGAELLEWRAKRAQEHAAGFDARLDDIEKRLIAIDAKLDKLLAARRGRDN